jgi:hypothetical protein
MLGCKENKLLKETSLEALEHSKDLDDNYRFEFFTFLSATLAKGIFIDSTHM